MTLLGVSAAIMKKILVTGSNGLIGSEVVNYFDELGWSVTGVDNNMRKEFFGDDGDTLWNRRRLLASCMNFEHYDFDIRDRQQVLELMKALKPNLIVHCAAQPSHDLAALRPFEDFEVNAMGTHNLLEAARAASPNVVFVHMSTNKVYGDRPNLIKMKETVARWIYDDPDFADGIDESMSIDNSTHSLFGVSKAAADLLVQEYGRSFGMHTCCLRGGCLTGPAHSGVELHGFLSHLIRCNIEEREYTVYGYKGKQVRDNIHSLDVARCIEQFYETPSSAEIFNLGGGSRNSISILEAFERVSRLTGKPMLYRYEEEPRKGDHICYISDLTHIRRRLPGWDITLDLDDIFEEIIGGWKTRL